MNKLSLFTETEFWTQDGHNLSQEARAALEPIILKWSKQFKTRDIEAVISSELQTMIVEERLCWPRG